MCGIAGFRCFGAARPEYDAVRGLLVSQEIRGRDSAGVAFWGGDGFERTMYAKRPVEAKEFADKVLTTKDWDGILASPSVLLHARASTKGSPKFNENNHPVIAEGVVVVHNGVITNDDELYEHLGKNKPEGWKRTGEVDTSAINLLLSQGETLKDSIKYLSTLYGSATLAAWRQNDPETMVLARINGPQVWLNWDYQRKILYWSSEQSGLLYTSMPSIGGLFTTNVTALDQNTALFINKREFQLYKVPSVPFVPPKPKIVTGNDNSQSNLPARQDHWGRRFPHSHARTCQCVPCLDDRNRTSGKAEEGYRTISAEFHKGDDTIFQVTGGIVTPKEDYDALGKPEPQFMHVVPSFYGIPPKYTTIVTIQTGFGVWTLKPDGTRRFDPHRRVGHWWDTTLADTEGKLNGVHIMLPADEEMAKLLENLVRLEAVLFKDKENVIFHAYMCPWCGITARLVEWRKWTSKCPWCNVVSPLSFRG